MRTPKTDATKKRTMLAPFGILALVVILLSGCTSIGPTTIERDRFDYVSAISESWKRQTLLNLVKTRYIDVPVFLDIASVINQYSMERELSLGIEGEFYNRSDPSYIGPSIGATGRYTDRPTITYNPLMGQNFARSLMRPIPLPAILFLLESGYPADHVLRICVQNIQGLQNCRNGPLVQQEGEAAFYELLDLLLKLKEIDGFTIRSASTDSTAGRSLVFKTPENEAAARYLRRIKQLLKLDPTYDEFPLIPGSVALNHREIAILSRSMMQIMTEFAAFIDVPEADIAEGRVYAIDHEAAQAYQQLPPLIRIHNSLAEPERPHVTVPYRGSWFWIDDRDIHSKTMFYFLMVLFSSTERGESAQAAPIISVPTN